eukprot:6213070-Pleurochrysis_carterae.AAC.3
MHALAGFDSGRYSMCFHASGRRTCATASALIREGLLPPRLPENSPPWQHIVPCGVDLAGDGAPPKAKLGHFARFCNYDTRPYTNHTAGLTGSGRRFLNHSRDTIARNKSRTLASLRLLPLPTKH